MQRETTFFSSFTRNKGGHQYLIRYQTRVVVAIMFDHVGIKQKNRSVRDVYGMYGVHDKEIHPTYILHSVFFQLLMKQGNEPTRLVPFMVSMQNTIRTDVSYPE